MLRIGQPRRPYGQCRRMQLVAVTADVERHQGRTIGHDERQLRALSGSIAARAAPVIER